MFSNILGIWKRLIKYSAILFVTECFMLKLSRKIVRSSQPENAYIVSLGQLFLFCFLGYQQSLFFHSPVERNARDSKMTTRVTEGASVHSLY